jgi:hypothetical protein
MATTSYSPSPALWRANTRLTGHSRRRRVECCIVINMVGSASEAGQLLKSPRASTMTASPSSRIDENQLSTLACQHALLDHFCHRA